MSLVTEGALERMPDVHGMSSHVYMLNMYGWHQESAVEKGTGKKRRFSDVWRYVEDGQTAGDDAGGDHCACSAEFDVGLPHHEVGVSDSCACEDANLE